MVSFEHLDLLLGEALECMVDAAREVRELGLHDSDREKALFYMGNAIGQLWGIRDEILYRLKPELKRDFVREIEQDEKRWEDLNEINLKASDAELDGQIEEATKLFNKLLEDSRYGYFQLLAEAGLYRLSRKTGNG